MKPQFDLSTGVFLPHFIIPGTMPTLNEYLASCNQRPQIGAAMKRKYKNLACDAIRFSISTRHYKASKPLIVHFIYFESNRRRDKDNIDSMCRKCVFDALQDCGVIPNDGWHEIENYTHDFYVVDHPRDVRIEVYLEEIEDDM